MCASHACTYVHAVYTLRNSNDHGQCAVNTSERISMDKVSYILTGCRDGQPL